MSLHDGFAGELVELPLDIGLPYHGLAEGGKLTLPNAAEIDYPTPASGDVHIVRRPGWTMPVRTAGQIEADEAAGFEWRDYAIIVGRLHTGISANMLLGGRRLDGWIWFDADTQPWRVQVSSWGDANDTENYQMGFTFSRFGVMGGSADSFGATTPAFSLGQSGAPVVEHRPTPGGAYETLAVSNAGRIKRKLLDISPDGSRALFAAYVDHHDPQPGATAHRSIYIERIVGVFEISIASNGTVTGAALKSRAQCIGTIDWPDLPNPTWSVTQMEITTYDLPACSGSTSWEQVWQEAATSAVEYSQPYPDGTPVVRIPTTNPHGYGSFAPFSRSRSITGVIVGAYYDGLTVRYVTAAVALNESGDGDHTFTPSAAQRIARCVNGVRNDDPAITWSASSSASLVTEVEVSLSVDGVVVVTEKLESILENTSTGIWSGDIQGTSSKVIKRNGVTVQNEQTALGPQNFFGPASAIQKHIMGYALLDRMVSIVGITGAAPMRYLDFLAAAMSGAGQTRYVAPAHWNQTTIGLVSRRLASSGGAEHDFSTAYARGVAVAGAALIYTPISGDDVMVYPLGTYQPVTAQWSGILSESTPAPRAWV